MTKVTIQQPPQGFPQQIEVEDRPRSGGEGKVYFSKDGKYAVKIYHNPHPEKEKFLQQVMQLFSDIPSEQEGFLCPPLALVNKISSRKCVGFVMRRVPPHYLELGAFISSPVVAAREFKQGRTWADYLKVARSVANAVAILHGKGCAHADIHYRNFLVDIRAGNAVMLEIDGVVVPGFLPPQVRGMLGFMAPEILAQNVSPNERTDRHSLAILVLHTLLFRNVMMPLVDYDSDPNRSDELGYGQYALFSEHPQDRKNRPANLGKPLYRKGSLSYKMLTPALQKLTEKCLIDGIHAPHQRPLTREWEEALGYAMDELWNCPNCRQYYPYPHFVYPPQRRSCPFCGSRVAAPYPVVLTLYEERDKGTYYSINRYVVLGHNFRVYEDLLQAGCKPPFSRRNTPSVGHVEWDATRGIYRLLVDEDAVWKAVSPDGTALKASRSESIPLQTRYTIHFGEGRRIAYVSEDGRFAT